MLGVRPAKRTTHTPHTTPASPFYLFNEVTLYVTLYFASGLFKIKGAQEEVNDYRFTKMFTCARNVTYQRRQNKNVIKGHKAEKEKEPEEEVG